MSEQIKIWVTKYALTDGIFEVMAKVSDGMACYKREGSTYSEYVHGKGFHLDLKSAISEAEEMRIRKLKSLEKSMKKMSALKFP